MNMRATIALKPETQIPKNINEYMHLIDMVLVMTVEPGFGGQKFMPNVLHKVNTQQMQIHQRQIHIRDKHTSEANTYQKQTHIRSKHISDANTHQKQIYIRDKHKETNKQRNKETNKQKK
jgi:pentose-5-phosphate-3-epimerase